MPGAEDRDVDPRLRGGRLYHYKGKRRSQAALVKRIKEIAETRVRYGYRRVHVLLRREGWEVNAKRIYRLYKELYQRPSQLTDMSPLTHAD